MNKVVLRIMAYLFMLLFLSAWGFEPHRNINFYAIESLPKPLKHFYKKNGQHIRTLATKADSRRYVAKEEAPRHFINLDADYFVLRGKIPIYWGHAKKKYHPDSLQIHGTLPWSLYAYYKKLVLAFKARDINKIIDLSSDVGHYVADACVPLHITKNYNGQFTNQKGIHALWETEVPKIFSKDFDFKANKATYIPRVQKQVWKYIHESFTKKDSVLSIEKLTAKDIRNKYILSSKNKSRKRYTRAFIRKYHSLLNQMVETQMRKAIYRVASVWFSAWVDAGQPNLDNIGVYVPRKERKK